MDPQPPPAFKSTFTTGIADVRTFNNWMRQRPKRYFKPCSKIIFLMFKLWITFRCRYYITNTPHPQKKALISCVQYLWPWRAASQGVSWGERRRGIRYYSFGSLWRHLSIQFGTPAVLASCIDEGGITDPTAWRAVHQRTSLQLLLVEDNKDRRHSEVSRGTKASPERE